MDLSLSWKGDNRSADHEMYGHRNNENPQSAGAVYILSYFQLLTACYIPKRRLTFNGLHSVISQKIVLCITTAVRTSNPIYCRIWFEHISFVHKFFLYSNCIYFGPHVYRNSIPWSSTTCFGFSVIIRYTYSLLAPPFNPYFGQWLEWVYFVLYVLYTGSNGTICVFVKMSNIYIVKIVLMLLNFKVLFITKLLQFSYIHLFHYGLFWFSVETKIAQNEINISTERAKLT
jgi:hypothetical protein